MQLSRKWKWRKLQQLQCSRTRHLNYINGILMPKNSKQWPTSGAWRVNLRQTTVGDTPVRNEAVQTSMGHESRYSERHTAQGRDQPDEGEYRQFVSNRVHKIQQHQNVKWHHVPTTENPANLGSRGGSITDNQLWKQGPLWLSDSSKWPPGLVLEPCAKTKAELNMSQNILLDAHTLHKVLRISA